MTTIFGFLRSTEKKFDLTGIWRPTVPSPGLATTSRMFRHASSWSPCLQNRSRIPGPLTERRSGLRSRGESELYDTEPRSSSGGETEPVEESGETCPEAGRELIGGDIEPEPEIPVRRGNEERRTRGDGDKGSHVELITLANSHFQKKLLRLTSSGTTFTVACEPITSLCSTWKLTSCNRSLVFRWIGKCALALFCLRTSWITVARGTCNLLAPQMSALSYLNLSECYPQNSSHSYSTFQFL